MRRNEEIPDIAAAVSAEDNRRSVHDGTIVVLAQPARCGALCPEDVDGCFAADEFTIRHP